MPGDNMLSAGVATAVWGIWSAIELAPRRHLAIPSRDSDKGSSLALNVAHGCRLVGMLVGFLGVGRIDGADAPLQLSGLGLLFAGIAVRWTAIHALGVFFTGRVQIREGHTLVRTGLYSRLRHPAYAGSLIAYFGLGLAFSNGGPWHAAFCPI
jgi:protein-S-isoprenylcysteine O-methyltransferase